MSIKVYAANIDKTGQIINELSSQAFVTVTKPSLGVYVIDYSKLNLATTPFIQLTPCQDKAKISLTSSNNKSCQVSCFLPEEGYVVINGCDLPADCAFSFDLKGR